MVAMMTVDEIIDQLGGTGETARKLNVSSSRVSNWRKVGRFPDSVDIHSRLTRVCAPLGIELDVALFGWKEAV